MSKVASARTSPLTEQSGSNVSDQPMLILHNVWMTRYKGWEPKIYAAGFKWPAQQGWGSEMFNYDDVEGHYYGHVEIIERRIHGKIVQPKLHIEKLGASKKAQVAHGVLVVWTAPDPRRPGRTVVGWYQNASVYRERRNPIGHLKSRRSFNGQACSYRVVAAKRTAPYCRFTIANLRCLRSAEGKRISPASSAPIIRPLEA